MCSFITIVLKPAAEVRLRAGFGPGFELQPTANPGILRVLPPSFEGRLLTKGMCTCDLYRNPEKGTREPSTAELRAKYERAGWSKGKIDRAVSQILVKRDRTPGFLGLRADVASAIVAVARTDGPLAVVVHWYSGDVETEPLAIVPGPNDPCDDFPAAMGSLPVDTLVWANPGSGRN